ncbi:MAG: hypothetical protein ACM3XM_17580 [Mycobacterium leprae]
MANLRDWTVSEIMAQMPASRTILRQYFGPESTTSGATARLRELARWKGVDVDLVVKDLNAMAKATGMLT